MIKFVQLDGGRLYAATTVAPSAAVTPDGGWAGFLAAGSASALPTSLYLDQAVSRTDLAGSFVFSALTPNLTDVTAFIGQLEARIGGSGRMLLWLGDPANVTAVNSPGVGIANDGSALQGDLEASLVPGAPGLLTLNTANGAKIPKPAQADETLTIQPVGTNPAATLAGTARPIVTGAGGATLAFSGPLRGCLQFETLIARHSLADALQWGFQFVAPEGGTNYGEWLPLADGSTPSAQDWVDFLVSVDPSYPMGGRADPLAVRTALAFQGTNSAGKPEVLFSYYSATNGAQIVLVPVAGTFPADPTGARLVLNLGLATSVLPQARFQAAPAGDFALMIAGSAGTAPYRLLCGLQGTESLHFTPGTATDPRSGDRVRFVPRQKAFAPRFPPKNASPVEAPVDPTAPPLNGTFQTSWASFAPASGGAGGFVGQPSGFALFGADAVINPAYASIYGPQEFPTAVAESATFPLVPYAGANPGDGQTAFDAPTMQTFESQVLAPQRRAAIGSRSGGAAALAAADNATYNGTTPMGLLVAAAQSTGAYNRLLLARDRSGTEMAFSNLDPLLQLAFQSGQLCLVIANAVHLSGGSGQFANRVDIGGWTLTADVGTGGYADYANVIIVKGLPGPLYDPPVQVQGQTAPHDPSLVASPDKWTLASDFAAPGHSDDPAPHTDELVALSSWLQAYFADAVAQTDDTYFGHFKQIAADPTWTGILMLRMSIQPPPDLAGIRGGVRDESRFYTHHLGIEVSPVKNPSTGNARNGAGIQLQDASSMFGLIDYVDPAFVAPAPGHRIEPVLPSQTEPWDFILLSLKALFADSSVQSFESYAQLTVSELFGAAVTTMGGSGANLLNTIVLTGAYQDNGGTPAYSLTSNADCTFAFDNNVLQRVELTGAQLTTRSAADLVVSSFELQGYLDFACVQGRDGAFDVFSFGNLPGATALRKGLSFSGLAIDMSFSAKDPDPYTSKSMGFDAGGIRFDISTSTPRDGSVFQEFALQLGGLVSGDDKSAPAATGYLPVIGSAVFSGVDGKPWWALRYQLDMGTPGALAGDIGLHSTLLTAWTPTSHGDSGYEAFLGIELPGTGGGAKLISLENVLKLAIGQIRLVVANGAFLLLFTDISLRFLGLMKIPSNGNILFYLFGNPAGAAGPSGLGWYAMYKKDAPQSLTSVLDAVAR